MQKLNIKLFGLLMYYEIDGYVATYQNSIVLTFLTKITLKLKPSNG